MGFNWKILIPGLGPFFMLSDMMKPPPTPATAAPDKNSLEDINQPTTEEGRTIPLYFGTCLMGPNCVWSGDLKSKKTESHDIPTGYAYFLGMLYTIGGPIDNLLRFYRDDNETYKDLVFADPPDWGDPMVATDNFRETFRAQTGKAREKGQGGSRTGRSTIRLYRGNQPKASDNSAAIDSYLSGASASGDATRYPGMSYLAMNRVFIGDDASAVPAYTAVVVRTAGMVHQDLRADWPDYEINFTSSGYDENYADANPAYAILYLLTKTINPDDPFSGAFGMSEDLIDLDSIKDGGEVLKAEGCGISFSIDDARKIPDTIAEIERHIDGKMYWNDTTGLYTLKLFRDDYDIEDLEELTDADYSGMVFTRRTPYDCFTDLELRYTSRRTLKETGLALLINSALRDMLGVVKSKRVVLPMFTYPASASAAQARLQKRFFYPWAVGSFTISRNKMILNPGDVVLLPSVAVGSYNILNTVIRVLSVSAVDDSALLYRVEWEEDIFNAQGVVTADTGAGDYEETDWRITGAYRYTTFKDAPQEFAAQKALMVLTARPDGPALGAATDWQVQDGILEQDEITGEITGDVTVLGGGQVNATGLLDLAYSGPGGDSSRWLDHTATGFTFDNAVDMEEFEDSEAELQKLKHVFLVDVGAGGSDNFEMIAVGKLADEGGGVWRATQLIRGLFGTPHIDVWPDNTRVWRVNTLPTGGNPGYGIVDISPVEILDGTPHAYYIVQFNQYETGDPLLFGYEYAYRPETPYGAADLTGERAGTDVTLTWNPRTRRAGAPFTDEVSMDAVPIFDPLPEAGQSCYIESDFGEAIFTAIGATSAVVPSPSTEEFRVYAFQAGRYSSGSLDLASVTV